MFKNLLHSAERRIQSRQYADSPSEHYALASGEAAADRLRLLHDVYEPGTRRALLHAGIQPDMRVADLGCGVGMVSELLAWLIGRSGHVVGVDFSADRLTRARRRLARAGLC